MLHETLRTLRKKKGYSQEEAAARLNVVRQTVSKWEKGLSVPDADALIRLAELYEVSVGDLLGTPPEKDDSGQAAADWQGIAEQLSRVNEQLVIRNRRAARIWRIVGVTLIACLIVHLTLLLSFAFLRLDASNISRSVTETHYELTAPE